MRTYGLSSLLMLALIPGLTLNGVAAARADTPTPTAKPFLGIGVETTLENAEPVGATVRAVAPDSPAAKAGFKKGDRVVKVGNTAIKDARTLVETISAQKPGDKLTLHVLRDGKEQALDVTLGESKRPVFASPREQLIPKGGAFLGVWSRELTPEMKKELNITVEHGTVVVEVMPDSPAAKAGLQKNDLITKVGDQAINNQEELRGAIQKAEAGKEVMLEVVRGKEVKQVKATLVAPAGPFGRHGHFSFPRGLSKEMERHLQEIEKRFAEWERNETPNEP